ncbi:bifunctional 2-polyprenyl-6-hydroxyphenol methylase/3-demethylubiquinol 3-O-methyltransferase UbiG [Leptospira noguchii]|uniref:class I SAM-dependent methyltransferase n=1 Tax=Leptospira noguchii TaxID=28182 RepID=UPI0011470745|nr:class I SAM-dependent methyltransferase [Leptospira noguchii]TQE84045.1 class I SAM-dependent methyltransferase [Leptospira noguchii]UOG54020.1 class I SAM-dependent methyltransferase [Leptospira noguchii]
MTKILRSAEIKPDFDGLKNKWEEMLSKYYLDSRTLNSKYTLETNCPFCDSKKVDQSFNLNGFHHNICVECKTLYVSPRLSNVYIEELYNDEYYSEMYTRSMLPIFEKRKQLIGRRKYIQTINHYGDKPKGNVLDIGAGIGEVTDVFREEGWESYAIEMNKVAVSWLQTRKHKEVFHGPLEEYKTSQKFDIVMAWGVVEHVLDPNTFLKRVYELLNPGGLFVSEVPHGQSLLVDVSRKTGMDPKRILMGEQHIVLYSTDAYKSLHERNGFKKIHIQTNGLDVDTIFRVNNITISDEILASMQESIDEKLYGDLLRGFWRK